MLVGVHSENRLLSSLPAADFDLLRRHLRSAVLSSQLIIYEPGIPVTKAYFPHGAAISLVVMLFGGQMIEATMVGRDGMLGGFAALSGQSAGHRAIVQIEGPASVMDLDALRHAADSSEAIRSMLFRNERSLLMRAQHAAACNAAHSLEARFSRWLLRARDACGKSTLATTQESIAELLGVRRTSVSLVAHGMQQARVIKTRRGQIEILDLTALQESACECYANIVAHCETPATAGDAGLDDAQIA